MIPEIIFVREKSQQKIIGSKVLKNKIYGDLLFHMNNPMSAIATTAPVIKYSSIAVIDGAGAEGLLNLTEIDKLCPVTVMLPDVLFAE